MNTLSKGLLVINGSLRQGGNTDVVTRFVMKGAEKTGMPCKEVKLRELSIKDCDGCYQCIKTGACLIADDMQSVYKSLEKANILVFATPNYFCGVTGIMKVFLDRLFVYFHKSAKHRIEGKTAILLVTMNQKDEPKETKLLYNTFKVVFKHIGILLQEVYYFSEIMEKEAVILKPDYLKMAENIGYSLTSQCEKTDASAN